LFRFEAKITKSKRTEKFEAKKRKNAKIMRKIAKITQKKRSEKFEAKISEKKRKKRCEIL
jgi:hypothetical protein